MTVALNAAVRMRRKRRWPRSEFLMLSLDAWLDRSGRRCRQRRGSARNGATDFSPCEIDRPPPGGTPCQIKFSTKHLKAVSLTLVPQLNDLYHIDVKADNARSDTMLLPRIATILNNARSRLGKEHVVLCVAGDFLAPSCLSKHFFGEHMVDVLNALETKFVSLGNHEFDIPAAQFLKRIDESNFQWLCTNFRFLDDEIDDSPKIQPAGLVDLAKDVRLCLFGVLYPSAYKDFGRAIDPVEEIRALIGKFESTHRGLDRRQSLTQYSIRMAERIAKGDFGYSGVAAYAALTHQNTEGDRRLAAGVPQLFALLGGHEHEVVNRHNLFGSMIAKGLSNARTLRLNWFAAVKISDLEKIEGFGKDPPQVLLDIAAEIYLEAIVPESQRLFIESLSTRTLEQLDALTDTGAFIFSISRTTWRRQSAIP